MMIFESQVGKKMMNTQTRNGFTLIELLLVLVILASLTAIVAPKFTNRAKEAKITQARTQISQFSTALDAFNIDLGRFPTTTEGLDALVEKPTGLDKWREPYLSRRTTIPLDPWGKPYIYKCPGQHNQYEFDLSSWGPDMKAGGGDDIDNWSDEGDAATIDR